MRVDIGKECLEGRYVLSNNYRVWALDLSLKLHFAQYLLIKWMNFDKIMCFGIY